MGCARMRTRAVRPRWTWLFMRSTACWSWDARATSASPEPGRGWGDCVHTPDRCTTLAAHATVARNDKGVLAALLDVYLDPGTAAPAAEILRAAGVPYAVITGYDGRDLVDPVWQGVPYLTKPFTIEQVQALVRELLSVG